MFVKQNEKPIPLENTIRYDNDGCLQNVNIFEWKDYEYRLEYDFIDCHGPWFIDIPENIEMMSIRNDNIFIEIIDNYWTDARRIYAIHSFVNVYQYEEGDK